MSELAKLLEIAESGTMAAHFFDEEIARAICARTGRHVEPAPPLVSSLDAATNAFKHVLPHWWISSGICTLGPHASCGPEGRAFKAAGLPYPAQWDDGFHVDFKHDAPEALARVAVMLRAMIATREAVRIIPACIIPAGHEFGRSGMVGDHGQPVYDGRKLCIHCGEEGNA